MRPWRYYSLSASSLDMVWSAQHRATPRRLVPQEAIATLLLEEAASVNVQTERGDTALIYAAVQNHEAVAALLLKNGATIDAVNEHMAKPR